MAEHSEAKKREAKLRFKNHNSEYIDAMLCFAELDSLSHFQEINTDNNLVNLLPRVKRFSSIHKSTYRRCIEPALV